MLNRRQALLAAGCALIPGGCRQAGEGALPSQALWTQNGQLNDNGRTAMALMQTADRHGLRPEDYMASLDSGLGQDFERQLTQTFLRFANDVRTPHPELYIVDPLVEPMRLTASSLRELVRSGGPDAAVWRGDAYEQLADRLVQWRREWRGLPHVPLGDGPVVRAGERSARVVLLKERLALVDGTDRLDTKTSERLRDFQTWHGLPVTGALDRATATALDRDPEAIERAIVQNLRRLAVLPAEPHPRSVMVNIATAELAAMEKDQVALTMKVVVGKPSMPTPLIAGALRFMVVHPYWNLPQDLVRLNIVPLALSGGDRALAAGGYELLKDFSANPQVLSAAQVDWRAVARGEARVRVRQKPGPNNMMGKAKFMLPNDLGIYLHDTPHKSLFSSQSRTFSAGCVRLEDAEAFTRWLVSQNLSDLGDGTPEQPVPLHRPVPVYLLYQTVTARDGGGLSFGPDPYGLDLPA